MTGRGWKAALLAAMGLVVACKQGGTERGALESAAPAPADDEVLDIDVRERPPEPSLASLGPSGRRVKIIVRPGDASVEVDGFNARRRDGVIELTGRVGDVRRLRVTKGSQQIEKDVRIQDKEASPASLDLAELLAAARSAGPRGAAKRAGPVKPADVLLPDAFE